MSVTGLWPLLEVLLAAGCVVLSVWLIVQFERETRGPGDVPLVVDGPPILVEDDDHHEEEGDPDDDR